MSETLCVTGLCVDSKRRFIGTIIIDLKTGLIKRVIEGWDPSADIKATDLIFPGFIDVHTHGREDVTGEDNYKEDFYTLGQAAVNGGVVHVGEMGNNPCPPIDDETYTAKELLTAKSAVPVTLYAMIGPSTNPLSRRVPYKICHTRTTGKNDLIFFPSRIEIEDAARKYWGRHASHHCEDTEILASNKHQPTHEDRRPPEAEETSIDFALYLIENYFGKGKLCHCSVYTGLQKIEYAKSRGVQVTCEITPHHLYFDRSMITEDNQLKMRMNPPLRSPEDRLGCIEALKKGRIDMIASDHAPHTPEDQERDGVSGHPHLDTLGPFVTWLMDQHSFTPFDIARVCSGVPAEFLNQFLPDSYGYGYGSLAVGYMGSLTLIDRYAPITISKEMLKTKCGWSPFEGVTFSGSVQHTIVKGKVLK